MISTIFSGCSNCSDIVDNLDENVLNVAASIRPSIPFSLSLKRFLYDGISDNLLPSIKHV